MLQWPVPVPKTTAIAPNGTLQWLIERYRVETTNLTHPSQATRRNRENHFKLSDQKDRRSSALPAHHASTFD